MMDRKPWPAKEQIREPEAAPRQFTCEIISTNEKAAALGSLAIGPHHAMRGRAERMHEAMILLGSGGQGYHKGALEAKRKQKRIHL